MRVLVTGAAGMLGTDLCTLLDAEGAEVHAADIRNSELVLDITKPASVRHGLEMTRPDVVIHCAAYTNVEAAEARPADAYRVNALGSWLVAQACERVGASVCYVSTDFVFDGSKLAPYHEFDTPHPLNVYAASKLAGEKAISRHCRRHWIARTAWLYGFHGRSFVRTILEKASAGQSLRVVADQVGSPTYTRDLAGLLSWLVRNAPHGTYHCVNAGEASWYELAREALKAADVPLDVLTPVAASDWVSSVRRPPYSVLGSLALPAVGAPALRPWQQAVAAFVRELAGRPEAPEP